VRDEPGHPARVAARLAEPADGQYMPPSVCCHPGTLPCRGDRLPVLRHRGRHGARATALNFREVCLVMPGFLGLGDGLAAG